MPDEIIHQRCFLLVYNIACSSYSKHVVGLQTACFFGILVQYKQILKMWIFWKLFKNIEWCNNVEKLVTLHIEQIYLLWSEPLTFPSKNDARSLNKMDGFQICFQINILDKKTLFNQSMKALNWWPHGSQKISVFRRASF